MVEEHSKRVDGFSEVVVYCDSNRVWCMGEQMFTILYQMAAKLFVDTVI